VTAKGLRFLAGIAMLNRTQGPGDFVDYRPIRRDSRIDHLFRPVCLAIRLMNPMRASGARVQVAKRGRATN
jgi:hypothetical protein